MFIANVPGAIWASVSGASAPETVPSQMPISQRTAVVAG